MKMKLKRKRGYVFLCYSILAVLFIYVYSIFGYGMDCNAGQSSGETSKYSVYEDRINKGIEKGLMYECALLIGQGNEVLFQKAYGEHVKKGALLNKKVPPGLDAIYDIASITKPVATVSSILILYDMGKLSLEDQIVDFIPEFKGTNKESITVLQLLTHTSGFKYDRTSKPTQEGVINYVKDKKLSKSKSSKMSYSGINFQLLQIIVERVSGESLNTFSAKHVFFPLKMEDTMFNPSETLIDRLVPNKNKDGFFVWGKSAGGMTPVTVSGANGLFSTVSDLSKYCRMIINQGELDGVRIIKKETVIRMISEKLGWLYFKKDSQSIFHLGGTGCMLYINHLTKKYLVYLSNGFHSYFKKTKEFGSFLEGFAEFADGQEFGTIGKMKLISR